MQCFPVFSDGIDQLPALVDGQRGGHLGEGMFAGRHGVDAHPRVPVPGGGDDHDVNVVALEHPLVVRVAPAVGGGFFPAGIFHPGHGRLERRFVVVGDGHDFDAFQRHHGRDVA